MLSVALNNPTVEDVKNAVDTLKAEIGYDKAYPHQKIIVNFSEEVSIRADRRTEKMLREAKVKFFEGKHYGLCYSFHERTGYPLSCFEFTSKIVSLSILDKDELDDKHLDKARAVLNRIHKNAWDNLRSETPKSFFERFEPLKLINMSRRFPQPVIKELEKAFENKTKYHYHQYGERRHWTLETKLCEDGIFRAWYSSEYDGCANGQYYLLLNPYTALWCEND